MVLNLTYIPSSYWTKEKFFCDFLNPRVKPPEDSSFFVMWDRNINEVAELDQNIEELFPEIPVKKLLTCKIRLITSPNKIQLIQKQYFPVSQITAKVVPIPPMLKKLFGLRLTTAKNRTESRIFYSDSVKTWAILVKFTMEILTRGNFVPKLEKITENHYQGQWNLIFKGEKDYQRFNKLIKDSAWASRNLPIDIIPLARMQPLIKEQKMEHQFNGDYQYFTTGLWHPSYLFTEFINSSSDFLIRSFLQNGFYKKFTEIYQVERDPIENICVLTEDDPWDIRFIDVCIGKNKEFDIERFCDTPIPNILRNWVQKAQGFPYSLGVNLTFRLEYPDIPDADWDLGFYIQPLEDLSNFIPLMDVWEGIVTYQEAYKNVCSDNHQLQEELLRALGIAAKLFPPIRLALEGKNPHHVKLTRSQVMSFLKQGQYFLSQAGFKIALPEEFQQQGEQRLSARMVIKSVKEIQEFYKTSKKALTPVSAGFDMDSMLEFHWEAQLGKHGEILTDEEFSELVQSAEPLIYWRGNWVLVDPQDMESLKPIFEKQKEVNGTIAYAEALKLGLSGGIQLRDDGTKYEVVLEGNFQNVISEIQNVDHFQEINPPNQFQGKLRPYQQTALTWLTNMAKFNFGVILADDMGLGKTVEVLAFLSYQKSQFPNAFGSILVICPTSLIFNWKREINRFTPDFDVKIHHGSNRPKELEAVEIYTHPHRIIMTTYGTVRNDIDFLETIPFAGIILDESQNIKNYQAQQTQAILKLQARYRIALSGTPIENRLMELWTLFRFLNPGLLGSQKQFQTQFVTPIERFQDEQAANKLQKFISPFLMRRLKTDRNIIKDLPEKNEIKQYLTLTPLQKKLYAYVVKKTLNQLESAEITQGKRRGLVLKLLTQTKQICNHPYQYWHISAKDLNLNEKNLDDIDSDEDIFEEAAFTNIVDLNQDSKDTQELYQIKPANFIKYSIKLQRLLEMIDEILEEGEKILIFTQFKQMGDLLKLIIEEVYPFEVGWFHGGISPNQRKELIDDFQSRTYNSIPILILSLKAGGTGLNLTQASTVFHFDRWWNPAVEDQATDRAYRIGQEQRVNVYKFISTGTIEEKIDNMLEQKRELANSIIGTAGETWITELSNDELSELFSLNTQEE